MVVYPFRAYSQNIAILEVLELLPRTGLHNRTRDIIPTILQALIILLLELNEHRIPDFHSAHPATRLEFEARQLLKVDTPVTINGVYKLSVNPILGLVPPP